MTPAHPGGSAPPSRCCERRPSEYGAPEVLVLFSGGIDSSTLLAFYKRLKYPVVGLFIEHGQPAAVYEARAVTRVSEALNIPALWCSWQGPTAKQTGLIQGRNAFLLTAALMEAPPSVRTIAIGVHAGTPYADCGQKFIDGMQQVVRTYGAPLSFAAPFVDWRKADVFSFAVEAGVPIDLTYSCERGTPSHCGSCASCQDREALYAGT